MLGPVRLLVDREPVPLTSAQQRAVLARLALEPDQPVSASRLVDTLWPTSAPSNALGNLQSYVSRLRTLLGPDRLVHEPGGYRLMVSPMSVDVGAAHALADEGASLAAGDPGTAAERVQDALNLWRGEPLSDLPDRLVFAPEIAQLEAWRQQLVEDRAELRLASGDAAAAVPDLERAVAGDPLREKYVELLVRALHAVRRTADALATVSSYRRRLAEETGLDPSAEIRELEQRILTEDPEPGSSAQRRRAAAPHRRPRSLRPPSDLFIGRDADLDQLRQVMTAHRMVTVVGPGGIGKTRLMLELLGSADRSPAMTDEPLVSALVELAAVGGADDVAAATAAALGVATAPTGMIDALVDRLSGEPTVVVLDNCEHVLSAVAELAGALLSRCPELSVLATSRRRLEVDGECVVRLGPLATRDQVELFCHRAAMLRAGFTDSEPARRLVTEICGRLDGLPLAVELAAQRESVFGLSQLRDGMVAGLSILDPIGSGGRAGGIAPAAEWSYRLLDEGARVLFDRLTVCSGGFSLDALRHFAPEDGRAPALLAELVDASMVLIDHAQRPPRYRILEPIRQVGEQHLDHSQRHRAAEAHGSWLREHVDVARHAQNARSPDAGRLLERERANLRQALRRSATEEAWQDAAHLGIQTALLAVDHPGLDLIDQLAQLEHAVRHADVSDETRARCLAAAGTSAWLSGRAAEGVKLCNAAVDLLPDDWACVFLRAQSLVFVGGVEAIEWDTRTLLADDKAPAWARATTVCIAAMIREFSGDHDAAAQWVSSESSLLDQVGAADGFVSYTHGELMVRADPAGALRAFDHAEELASSQGHGYAVFVAQVGKVGALTRLGEDSAADICLDALVGTREAGMWPQVWMLLRLAAELLVDRGDADTATALLDAADADPFAPPILTGDVGRIARIRAAATSTAARAASPPLSRAEAVTAALEALQPRG